MWIFTPVGFFSIVQKPFEKHGILTVRSRNRSDLVALKSRMPDGTTSAIVDDVDADYQYRLTAKNSVLSAAMSELVFEIDYENFKAEVDQNDPERAKIYAEIWTVLWAALAQNKIDGPEN